MGLDRRTYRDARDTLQEYDLIQAHTNHSGSFAKAIGHRLGSLSLCKNFLLLTY
jgi:hypothetical protein